MKTINSQKKILSTNENRKKTGTGFVISIIGNNDDEDIKKEDIKNA